MHDDEALAAVRWIESIDMSSADAATCEHALVVLEELRDRFDDALDHLVVRLQPPICSIHCHAPLRRLAP